MTGTIKTIVVGKPFGFIKVEGRDKDLFFHANDMKREAGDDAMPLFSALQQGDTVDFEVAETEKGPSARNVAKM